MFRMIFISSASPVSQYGIEGEEVKTGQWGSKELDYKGRGRKATVAKGRQ